jgi:hypothetical protein
MVFSKDMGTAIYNTLLYFLILTIPVNSQKADSFDSIAGYLKTSDSRKIGEYFAPLIEMNILMDENEYSKAQAELILRDFLSKNKPVSVKVIHRLSSNPNFRFAVLSLQSEKNKFRVSISMSKDGELFFIKVIRIEYDKE